MLDREGRDLDEALWSAPESGLRLLTCHGNPGICREIALVLDALGCRRVEAEAVWEGGRLAGCRTETEVAAFLLEGKAPEPLLRIALVGLPNAGKSSLLNLLAEEERALVRDDAHTTRDPVRQETELFGRMVEVLDTPGFGPGCALAAEAQKFGRRAIAEADLLLWVWDATTGEEAAASDAVRELAATVAGRPLLLVMNKSDLPGRRSPPCAPDTPMVEICSQPEGASAAPWQDRREMRRRVEAAIGALASSLRLGRHRL